MMQADILKSFKGYRSLVTGGTGLIGRQVVQLLCDAGAQVRIVSLDRVGVDSRAEHIYGDLTSLEFCKDVTRGMDGVFHLAGVKGAVDVTAKKVASHFVPILMMNTNVLEACRFNGVKRAVYTSSIGAYSNMEVFRESEYRPDSMPMDFAGWAKRMGELQIHAYKEQYGLDTYAIVRPANVYGPGDNFDPHNAMVIPSLMCRIRQKENPLKVWGDGSAIRDFAYSRDVAEGVILALYYGTKGSFVNLGSGRGVSIRELVETLSQFLDFKYVFDASKPSGCPIRIMDITLAQQTIKYNPSTLLFDGLKQTWGWFIQHENEYLNKHNYFTQATV